MNWASPGHEQNCFALARAVCWETSSGNWSTTQPDATLPNIVIRLRSGHFDEIVSKTQASEPSPMSIAEKFVSMEYGPAPEDPKEAVAWLERHGRRFNHFIGGHWLAPAAGEYFDTIDPSNGDKLASVAQGSSADI